ncbi:MAG: hypothetical protein LBQ23_01330 [Puniceicoccales bacterium]|jgi:oligopeptide transport system substrate-binding protein|nr:hypothetical protein [Puniceicoccales bacterium]
MWEDGIPVTARDFVDAVKRALSSKFACTSVDVFFPICNARGFFNRTVRNFSKVGIRAIDSGTLGIELEKSNLYFLMILMYQC